MSLSTLRNPDRGNVYKKTNEPHPPIPFRRPQRSELRKDDYMTFKLKSIPGDPASAEVSINVPYFSTGSVETLLEWDDHRNQVIAGQNLTTRAQKYVVTRLLLKGDALASFNAKAATYANENQGTAYEACIQALFTHVFPRKALAIQKRNMNMHMKKLKSVKARAYSARIVLCSHSRNQQSSGSFSTVRCQSTNV